MPANSVALKMPPCLAFELVGALDLLAAPGLATLAAASIAAPTASMAIESDRRLYM
jgi:hypothetical protein